MAKETLSLQTFAAEFLSLARMKRTGTYQVICADGRQNFLLMQDGLITDVDTREETSLLTAAIQATGRLSEKELKRARKVQAKSDTPLGAILLAQVSLPEEELLAAVSLRITDAICSLFTTSLKETTFIEHAADERLDGFASELSEVLEVYADPEELFLEAARRMGRWDLVERGFSFLRDVVYATPSASKYFRSPEAQGHEVVILSFTDGRLDVAEVIDRAVQESSEPLDPFHAFTLIRAMIVNGELAVINPVQMFQFGVENQTSGNHEKALKLYTRASERGLDDFDLTFKIAQTLEALGRRTESAVKYHEFGEKCLTQFRADEALKSYQKAVELEPKNMGWQAKFLELLLAENRRDEALAHGIHVAGRHHSAGEARKGLDLLLDLRRRGFKDDRLGQKIVEMAEQCGDEVTLRGERKRLASDFHARKDVEKALQMYQQMFCEGNTSPEVRLKLIDLHHEKGNHQLVLEHIGALFSLSEAERIKDMAVLRRLHELVCDLRPGDTRSNRWLVEYHLRSDNRDAALAVLRTLAAQVDRKGDPRDLARVLRQLISLDGENLEHRWRLAKVQEKLEKREEQVGELRGIAQVALSRKDAREAERAFVEILKVMPLDVQARKALAEIHAARGEQAQAAVFLKDAAFLDLLAGNHRESQEQFLRVLAIEPGNAEAAHRLSELCGVLGDDQKAGQELLKAARLQLETRNLGVAREAVSSLLKLRPANTEAQDLLHSIEETEARLSEKAAPEPARRAAEPATITISRPGRENDEPFQPSAPVIKKSVAGITARLRGLKSGAGGGAPADAAAGSAAAEGHPAAADAGAHKSPVGAVRAKGAAVVSAASKLKALAAAGHKAPPHAEPAPTPPTIAEASDALAALTKPASGETPAGSDEAGHDEPTPVHYDAAELERMKNAIHNASAAAAPTGQGPGRPLGKSAALLAKLRKGQKPAAGADGKSDGKADAEKSPELEKELG